jgi:hypothetical protein
MRRRGYGYMVGEWKDGCDNYPKARARQEGFGASHLAWLMPCCRGGASWGRIARIVRAAGRRGRREGVMRVALTAASTIGATTHVSGFRSFLTEQIYLDVDMVKR